MDKLRNPLLLNPHPDKSVHFLLPPFSQGLPEYVFVYRSFSLLCLHSKYPRFRGYQLYVGLPCIFTPRIFSPDRPVILFAKTPIPTE